MRRLVLDAGLIPYLVELEDSVAETNLAYLR